MVDDGFFIERSVLDDRSAAYFIDMVEANALPGGRRGGVRNLLDNRVFRDLAESPPFHSLVAPSLGDHAFVVRGILFDKSDTANWKVPWHQDVTIAVTDRVESDGYGPWSVKAGVTHVQAPTEVLENMISVRIHLDDCPKENGALRVLPGTHRGGKLGQSSIDEHVTRVAPVTCEARRGDALIMRPLLLHASSAAISPRHRRVLHFDYANVELAKGLQWRERCRNRDEMRGSLHSRCSVEMTGPGLGGSLEE